MMKRLLAVCFLASLLPLSGCRTTPAQYQDRSVQEARAFLLKKSPDLSPSEVAFVKFNRPALLVQKLTGGQPGTDNTLFSRDLSQICIAWVIPTRRPVYMVFGVSTGSMSDWKPERLILKTFDPQDRNRFAAVGTARNYAQNTLYHQLAVEDYNYLRFADPEVVTTDFEPAPFPEGKAAKTEKLTQTSLVWSLPDKPGKCIVITGYGAADLSGWDVNMGGERLRSEVDAHIVKTVESREHFVNESAAEKAAAEAKTAEAAVKPAAEAKSLLSAVPSKSEAVAEPSVLTAPSACPNAEAKSAEPQIDTKPAATVPAATPDATLAPNKDDAK